MISAMLRPHAINGVLRSVVIQVSRLALATKGGSLLALATKGGSLLALVIAGVLIKARIQFLVACFLTLIPADGQS